jgi:hypothetical protein
MEPLLPGYVPFLLEIAPQGKRPGRASRPQPIRNRPPLPSVEDIPRGAAAPIRRRLDDGLTVQDSASVRQRRKAGVREAAEGCAASI